MKETELWGGGMKDLEWGLCAASFILFLEMNKKEALELVLLNNSDPLMSAHGESKTKKHIQLSKDTFGSLWNAGDFSRAKHGILRGRVPQP